MVNCGFEFGSLMEHTKNIFHFIVCWWIMERIGSCEFPSLRWWPHGGLTFCPQIPESRSTQCPKKNFLLCLAKALQSGKFFLGHCVCPILSHSVDAFKSVQNINHFRGNLGNKMSIYAILYLFKLKYGYDIYVTKEVHDHLNYVFENLGNVK